ncbi:MAG: N-acetylmuramoyl-L-alanine amidase [Rikenellaceae bacterium]
MNIRTILQLSLLLLLTATHSTKISAATQGPAVINKVVIDAGHGGKDPGTVFKTHQEKNIVLNVALRLGALINEHYPEVEIIYTRKDDTFIPLDTRSDIANKAGADLFISIHVDATHSQSPNGISTFVMGVDKSNGNLDVAMRENDVITYESDYTAKYSGYSPGSSESFIIFNLMQYSYREQSMLFAQTAQSELIKNTGLNDRGVRQAGFLVLWKTTMPSVLVELGFITNLSDQKFLVSKAGQEKYSRALFNAFSTYKTKADGRGNTIVLDSDNIEEAANVVNIAPENIAKADPKPQGQVQTNSNNIVYRVQVCSSTTRIAPSSEQFKTYRNKVTEIKIGNLYKYYVEQANSYSKALSLQREVRKTFGDAFLVAFKGDSPIAVSEARKLNP